MPEIGLYAQKGMRFTRSNIREEYGTAFIRIDRAEALDLIRSLAQQMLTGNPNDSRQELFARDAEDQRWLVTIAVHDRL